MKMIEHELRKVERKIFWSRFGMFVILLVAALLTFYITGIPTTRDPVEVIDYLNW